jgi:hypothetical protein
VWLFLGQPTPAARTFALIYVSILLAILPVLWVVAEGVKRKFNGTLWREVAIQAMAIAGALAIAAGLFTGLLSASQSLSEGSSQGTTALDVDLSRATSGALGLRSGRVDLHRVGWAGCFSSVAGSGGAA